MLTVTSLVSSVQSMSTLKESVWRKPHLFAFLSFNEDDGLQEEEEEEGRGYYVL